ncbi:hypothetical protein BD626DRAFT_503844 [Schizophyllum amplum]|uniref:Uncharacterized protein n=1 Tax=Schizophyllum amplum TaxID=97359 RepID=A0A550C7K0_9AGAR|nr:hypothetical protein BD626DRAFT_503844 [Auriculariopsis ampla]
MRSQRAYLYMTKTAAPPRNIASCGSPRDCSTLISAPKRTHYSRDPMLNFAEVRAAPPQPWQRFEPPERASAGVRQCSCGIARPFTPDNVVLAAARDGAEEPEDVNAAGTSQASEMRKGSMNRHRDGLSRRPGESMWTLASSRRVARTRVQGVTSAEDRGKIVTGSGGGARGR